MKTEISRKRKRRPSAKALAKRQFILDYLDQHGSIEVIDKKFHDAFYQQFGGRRRINGGANPVYRAQRLLEEMVIDGTLQRTRVKSAFDLPGIPRWMWVYEKKREQYVW